MKDEEYIKSRVDDQIEWYDSKSALAQKWFKRLRSTELIAAASIPLIAGFATDPFPATFAVGLLGGVIATISGILSLFQFQEHWVKYRTTCESLKHEKYLYLTKAHPYHEAGSFNQFVQRVERLISEENSAWSRQVSSQSDEEGVDSRED